MQFIESLREESDLGQPSVATEAEDVVRIMSVHRSKGLEFPVVILPDLGKRINLQDCAGSILLDRQAGWGWPWWTTTASGALPVAGVDAGAGAAAAAGWPRSCACCTSR